MGRSIGYWKTTLTFERESKETKIERDIAIGAQRSILIDNGAYSIEIDGVHFQQITSGAINETFLLDIKFNTGFKIYGDVASNDLAIVYEGADKVTAFDSANIATSAGGQPTQLSETGSGIIKSIDLGGDIELTIDSIVLINVTKGGAVLLGDIKYSQSFVYKASTANNLNYNKIT